MSVEAMAVVLHHSRARGTDKLVLLGVANHEGDGGSWPALATLARYANVDARNVRAALRRLEALGELETHPGEGGTATTPDHERTNRYVVLVRCPAECDGTAQHRGPGDHGYRPRGGGGMPASPGGGMPASPGGGMPASPEPSCEPSCEPSPPSAPPRQRSGSDGRGGGITGSATATDPVGTDGYPTHRHHEHARRVCVRIRAARRLPLTPEQLLAWCYRLGGGDPWTGQDVLKQATDRELDTARDPGAALRARLARQSP